MHTVPSTDFSRHFPSRIIKCLSPETQQLENGVNRMAKCPYCNKPVTLKARNSARSESRPVQKEVVGSLKKEVMYSCPHCECVLGFGFFFGGVLTGRP
jgi:uncharacterized protein with PIN domain